MSNEFTASLNGSANLGLIMTLATLSADFLGGRSKPENELPTSKKVRKGHEFSAKSGFKNCKNGCDSRF